MLVQLLLLLLATLPLPSFATNTTSKGRGLLNRDAQGGSPLFMRDPGYHVAEVPPSDGPLQIRYIYMTMRTLITTTMMFTMITRASWNLRSILGIDEDAQTISLDATIRFQWKDTRVRQHPPFVVVEKCDFLVTGEGTSSDRGPCHHHPSRQRRH